MDDAAAVRDVDDLKQVEYQRLVEQGQEAARSQWTLGDLALQVKTKYGEGTIRRYAEDIGVQYSTLQDYRWVAAAYKSVERSNSSPWAVHQLFANQPDRVELVKAQAWTYREARKLVKERKAATGEQTGKAEYFPERVRELSERLSHVGYDDELSREFEAIIERIQEVSPNVVNELGSAIQRASIRLNHYMERLAERVDPFSSSTEVTVMRKELTS